MTKATIRSNLSDFIPDIRATQERNLDYVLGETNSYACHVCILSVFAEIITNGYLTGGSRRLKHSGGGTLDGECLVLQVYSNLIKYYQLDYGLFA